nr:reverse transcriptase domain-containing protein [Tanacetum cinerariifolium]
MYPLNLPPTIYPFYAQPINPLPKASMYLNCGPMGMFADSVGYVTPFVHWIKDYPLLEGLKMPSHVGSYDGKGDPDNYLRLFKEGWGSTRDFVTRYTDDTLQILRLHEEQCISSFVHGLKTRSLMEFLSTYLPITYKGLMKKTYTWIEVKEVATNGAPNDHRVGFDRFNKDRGHETNQYWELRHQIEEAVKFRQLAQLMKGIKKGKAKDSDTQVDKWKKGDTNIVPTKALILIISRGSPASKRKSAEELVDDTKEIIFPLRETSPGSDPLIWNLIIRTVLSLSKKDATRARIKLPQIREAHISPSTRRKKTSKVLPSSPHLGEHDIKFKGRNSIKGKILADFLAKTSSIEEKEIGSNKSEATIKEPMIEDMWKLNTDGASSSDGLGAGLMLVSLEGKEYTYALRFEFKPQITKQNTQHCWWVYK